jgi:hypothetical protein
LWNFVCGNIKQIFGLMLLMTSSLEISMEKKKLIEDWTTHTNWILDAETARLYLSF